MHITWERVLVFWYVKRGGGGGGGMVQVEGEEKELVGYLAAVGSYGGGGSHCVFTYVQKKMKKKNK
jgi:hypothetical protein